MDTKINKPRVFLSHSSQDKPFVKQIWQDFSECQIYPWLDEAEIRHGKPWLDEIFTGGIPSCDAVLVYFTENSIASEIVWKEIDAGILRQLEEKGIAFLPYVSEESLRKRLRADIRTLQVPVWNDENYNNLLPKVVAEIWRSFLERTVLSASQEEKVKRLQAELELEKLKRESGATVFSPSEEIEFEYIYKEFDRTIPITIIPEGINDSDSDTLSTYEIGMNLGSVIPLMAEQHSARFDYHHICNLVGEYFREFILETDGTEFFLASSDEYFEVQMPLISHELVLFELVAPE